MIKTSRKNQISNFKSTNDNNIILLSLIKTAQILVLRTNIIQNTKYKMQKEPIVIILPI